MTESPISPKPSFLSWLSTQTTVWISTVVLAFITFFSQTLTDRIKTGLNIANTRSTYYEKIAGSLSTYNYSAVGFYQLYDEGARFGRIDLPFAETIAADYNTSKVEVMQNEYIYKAQVKRFWGNIEVWKGLTLPVYYDSLYALMSKLDEDIHATNVLGITLDSLYKIPKSTYKLTKADADSINNKWLPTIKKDLDTLHARSELFLEKLE